MIRVGVLRGGISNQYEESLASGAYVLQHLPRDLYEPVDLFVDREGQWHLGGTPVSEDKLRLRVDVIWNALHGFYGEDGKAQQILENLGIPYIGSGPLISAIAMNKKLSKDYLAKLGVKTPRGIYIEEWGRGTRGETVSEVVRNITQKFSPPWIVEPISRGAGNGPLRCATPGELSAVLLQMFDASVPVLVEEAVLGKEMSISTVGGFRGQSVYAFLPAQKKDPHARMGRKESDELQKLGKNIHRGLGLGQYGRIEAVIAPNGHIYVLSADTLPSLGENADLHTAFAAVGSSFDEFAKHLISQALAR